MKHLDIHVTGKVQGVWFRAATKEEADRLGIVGHVQNEPDGSVRLAVEGNDDQLQALLGWLHEGPPLAEVSAVTSTEAALQHYTSFSIRR